MSTTAKRFVPGSVLTATAASYYTAPAATKAVIKAAAIVNTTAAAVQATVHIVPAAAGTGAATTIISGRPVAPLESYPCPELINQVLEAGDMLQAIGNGLTLMVSGVEIV